MKGDGTIYEHVGSYTELLDKLKNKPVAKQIKKPIIKEEPKKHERVKTAKLSYKEQYLSDNLPAEIAKLEAANKAIEVALGNPNLYVDDPQKFDELTTSLAANKEKIAQMENQWLEIQLKAEEIASATA